MAGLRPEIQLFAEAMERKLQENDEKGGWQDESVGWLFGRLREEVDELDAVLRQLRKTAPGSAERSRLVQDALGEAADVGNFAMMVSDNLGALPKEPTCTGRAASWCPVHGRCTCVRRADGERELNRGCPLHGEDSDHPKE